MDNYSAPVRTAAQLTELIEANRDKSRLLQQEERELRNELGRAKAREAVPHPLLGKRVKRRAQGPYGGKWRTERGTMCQHTGSLVLYVGMGQYRVTVEPGGTYVRTLSGRGAYPDRVDARHEAWELDAAGGCGEESCEVWTEDNEDQVGPDEEDE
jgi:hypothetical protein